MNLIRIFHCVVSCSGTFVLFDDEMVYEDAADDCASRGGTLAMATDYTTYETLRTLFRKYEKEKHRDRMSFPAKAAWVDGIDDPTNTGITGFYCATLGGACPATMPWDTFSEAEPDRTSKPNCAKVKASTDLTGLRDNRCSKKFVRICDLP